MCEESVKRLGEVEKRLDRLESQVGCIKRDTSDIVEMFRALSGGIKVLKWLGRLATPIVAIAAAWAAIKTGVSK